MLLIRSVISFVNRWLFNRYLVWIARGPLVLPRMAKSEWVRQLAGLLPQ